MKRKRSPEQACDWASRRDQESSQPQKSDKKLNLVVRVKPDVLLAVPTRCWEMISLQFVHERTNRKGINPLSAVFTLFQNIQAYPVLFFFCPSIKRCRFTNETRSVINASSFFCYWKKDFLICTTAPGTSSQHLMHRPASYNQLHKHWHCLRKQVTDMRSYIL